MVSVADGRLSVQGPRPNHPVHAHVFAMHYAGGGLISTSTKSRGSFAFCQECDQLGFGVPGMCLIETVLIAGKRCK